MEKTNKSMPKTKLKIMPPTIKECEEAEARDKDLKNQIRDNKTKLDFLAEKMRMTQEERIIANSKAYNKFLKENK